MTANTRLQIRTLLVRQLGFNNQRRQLKRRTLIITFLIATGLGVWLVVCLCTSDNNSRLTVVSDGPLDIRLWGIRPDAGDFIYDPNGKVIQETLGVALSDPPYWGEEFQCFDFIFALTGDE